MPCEWLTPRPTERLDLTGAAFRDRRWHAGEPFHASTTVQSEIPYVTTDGGVRIVIYQGGRGLPATIHQIAVYGDDARAVAREVDAIQARLPLIARMQTATFHRIAPGHTAAAAGPEGVWYLDSSGGRLLWSSRDVDPEGAHEPDVIATGLHSPVALAGGDDGLYVTSCDDPRACRLVRIDPETRAVTWLPVSLDQPQQLAVIDRVVYAACADGLVAIDATGAREIVAIGDAPPPYLLCASGRSLAWSDRIGKHVVIRRADGDCEVVATIDERIEALDLDDDRAYVLDVDGGVHEARRGIALRTARASKTSYGGSYAGIVRVGPYAVTAFQYDSSWDVRTRLESVPVGYPHLDDAPAELRAAAVTDDEAASVLADWLQERGVTATAYSVRNTLEYGAESFDSSDHSGEVVGGIARELVTFDRDLAYRVFLGRLIATVSGNAP